MTVAPQPARPPWAFRAPLLTGGAALVLLLLGLGTWAASVPIAGAIVASGRVEVSESRQVVQHPDGGVVSEIRVREGDIVAQGDVLIRLDGEELSTERAATERRLFHLRLRMARLRAERDGAATPDFPPEERPEGRSGVPHEASAQIAEERRLFLARVEQGRQEDVLLARQIEQIRSRIAGIDAQLDAIARQIDLIDDELAGQSVLLAEGLARQATVLGLGRERARLEGMRGELVAERAGAESRREELALQISAGRVRRHEAAARELRDLVPEEQTLEERLRILSERIARLDLRAPAAGVVLAMTVTTPRAVVRAADPVLYLVPSDRPLRIGVQISPADVDEIFPGQPVALLAPTLSGRSAPYLSGHVALVSADAFTDPDTHSSYFRVEVALDPGEEARLGERALAPGMPVEVFIRTGAHTPLAWLTGPFVDYFRHALREG